MKITAIMATCGRHFFCERSVGMFLAQKYENKHLLIIQNSEVEQKLDKNYENITLINKSGFTNLGAIYNYALDFVPSDTDVFCLFDDDDMYMPEHMTEGANGLIRGKKMAYKPKFSFFQVREKISKANNVFEPSWFVDFKVVKEKKFREESNRHHYNWVEWCQKNRQLYVDENGPSTLIYTWGNPERGVFKTSGHGKKPNVFELYREYSKDHGDGIITPNTKDQLDAIYEKFYKWQPEQS